MGEESDGDVESDGSFENEESEESHESHKEVAQEQSHLHLSPNNNRLVILNGFSWSFEVVIDILTFSYLQNSVQKLEEDEMTLMKWTNETLKQQPSEDFTNINEDEPFIYPNRLSSALEQFENENGNRIQKFRNSKQESNGEDASSVEVRIKQLILHSRKTMNKAIAQQPQK